MPGELLKAIPGQSPQSLVGPSCIWSRIISTSHGLWCPGSSGPWCISNHIFQSHQLSDQLACILVLKISGLSTSETLFYLYVMLSSMSASLPQFLRKCIPYFSYFSLLAFFASFLPFLPSFLLLFRFSHFITSLYPHLLGTWHALTEC